MITNSLGVRLTESTSVPAGSAVISGNIVLVVCNRMTSTVKIAIRPKIIVAVSVVTSRLKNRRFAGSGGFAGTSD
jgi:hypothetical protein